MILSLMILFLAGTHCWNDGTFMTLFNENDDCAEWTDIFHLFIPDKEQCLPEKVFNQEKGTYFKIVKNLRNCTAFLYSGCKDKDCKYGCAVVSMSPSKCFSPDTWNESIWFEGHRELCGPGNAEYKYIFEGDGCDSFDKYLYTYIGKGEYCECDKSSPPNCTQEECDVEGRVAVKHYHNSCLPDYYITTSYPSMRCEKWGEGMSRLRSCDNMVFN